MPWKVTPVSEIRLAFVHQVVTLRTPVSRACRAFGISRKTGYKWLGRYRSHPEQSLRDRSRRPRRSPGRDRRAGRAADPGSPAAVRLGGTQDPRLPGRTRPRRPQPADRHRRPGAARADAPRRRARTGPVLRTRRPAPALVGIHPVHGRPYHPQTQGKVERLHGTLEREVWPHIRRDCLEHFDADLQRWRSEVYNTVRPHEALGDQPPISRLRPSPRPPKLPPVEYPAGALLRKVSTSGDVRWRTFRLLAGRGLVGQWVRIEERDGELALYYCWKEIRRIPLEQLKPGPML